MTTLGEDAEAFFRTGDEGTYEGGPASDIPFALCDELAEDLTIRVTDEQLERRRRLKRIVATIVGTLGTGLLLLFAWLLALSAHATPVERTPAAARPLQTPHAAPTPPAPLPVVATAQAIATAPKEEPAAVPSKVSPTQNVIAARPRVSFEGHPRRQAVAPPDRSVPRAHASFGSTGPMPHGPPTANFPD